MRIAITGASGLIGSALAAFLRARGDDVAAIERKGDGPLVWATPAEVPDLSGFDAIVHLAGEPVASGRWSEEKRRRIRASRVERTAALAEALARMDAPPALISASAVGYYGATGDAVLTEGSPAGDDFLAEVCVAWEAACKPAVDAGVRVAHPRFGIVLHPSGGALAKMLPVFKMGFGGRLGSGSQYMAWIGLHDTVRALAFLIDGDQRGVFNITAPEPATNAAFTKALGKALGRPTVLPAPAFAIKLAFGKQMASQTVLSGQRARPARLLEAGFVFEQADLGQALSAMLG
jgi:uncharacterized protein (TIGR01777 family)